MKGTTLLGCAFRRFRDRSVNQECRIGRFSPIARRSSLGRHGTVPMRAIGTAGALVTIKRHGYGHFAGLVKAKGWHGRRPVSLAVDLAAGRVDAVLAA